MVALRPKNTKNLRKLRLYLEGGRHKLLKDLEKQMLDAAKAEKFEEAAEIRAQLFGLRELQKKIVFLIKNSLIFRPTKRLAIYKTCLIYLSHLVVLRVMIFHQSGTNVVGSMVVFTNGASDRSEYRKFKLRQQKNDDTANLHEVIERRLKHSEWMFPNPSYFRWWPKSSKCRQRFTLGS